MNPFGLTLPMAYTPASQQLRALARQEYIRQQEGKCWYCKHHLAGPPAPKVAGKPINLGLFPPGFMSHPIHLHHDHRTDLTIGAVHAKCNAVLYQYEGE